jgi:capsular polysaccharide transport system ATP-binding protein
MPTIVLHDVTKTYGAGATRKAVLDGVSTVFPGGRNIALMGKNGAGKSTLMRLLSGAELPDRGRITRDGPVSWPLGLSSGFNGSMSGVENALFVARLYNADPDYVLDYVRWFSELGPFLRSPIRTYSSGMKSRFAFGLSMALNFETYLVDEITAVGDASFKQKCHTVLTDRIGPPEDRRANLIMVSHSLGTIEQWCDCGYLLDRGRLVFHETTEFLIKAYKRDA